MSTTSTKAVPAPNTGFCLLEAIDNFGKSVEEATYGASRVRSEMDRLIYEHSEYLDRMTSSNNTVNDEEDIPMDAFEVLPLGKDEVRVEESTYKREPVLLQSAINDVRATYEEGAEEISRLCRNQSLIARHLVQKSVGHLLPPPPKEVQAEMSPVTVSGPFETKANPPAFNEPPIKEISFESDSDSSSAGIPRDNDFQELYSAFTKSFTNEGSDGLSSNASEAEYMYVPVSSPEGDEERAVESANVDDDSPQQVAEKANVDDDSLQLRDWKMEQTEASRSIEDDSILHLLSQDADDEQATDEEDEAQEMTGMDVAIETEKEILSQIFSELKEMEEEAKKADEQRRLREAEFEEAARVCML